MSIIHHLDSEFGSFYKQRFQVVEISDVVQRGNYVSIMKIGLTRLCGCFYGCDMWTHNGDFGDDGDGVFNVSVLLDDSTCGLT